MATIPRHESRTVAELALLVALLSAATSCSVKQAAPDIPLTFDGSSQDLKATEVVPTLDTPIPKGKNAIWCASFQSAWKALEALAGEAIRLSEMPKKAGQLNEKDIRFCLNRSGATLRSEAKTEKSAIPTNFFFERPFLVYLKKRGAPIPYFAMWVDNAELLRRWDSAGKPGMN